jgi:hypothetical protein
MGPIYPEFAAVRQPEIEDRCVSEAGMGHGRRSGSVSAAVAALAIGAVLGLGACSSSGSAKASTTNAGGSTTVAPAGSTVKPTSGAPTVSVDLVITGVKPATIKGTKGRCSLPSDKSLSSGYEFEGADYPSLGPDGVFNVAGPQNTQLKLPPSIKAIINGSGFLSGRDAGITVSPDRKSVTLDADIGGMTSSGQQINEHVRGHITCS